MLVGCVYTQMEGLYNSVVKYYPEAKADNFTLGKVVGMNFIYSATAFCTSIVAQDMNGTILHGRNLDYPIPVRGAVQSSRAFRPPVYLLTLGVVW